MLEIIILYVIQFLSGEVAGAIAAYVGTILSIIGWIRKVLRDDKERQRAEIAKIVGELEKAFTREIQIMNQEIGETKTAIERTKEKTDDVVNDIRNMLNQININLAEIKTELKLKEKK